MDLEICRICGGSQDLKNISDQDSEMISKLFICANIYIHQGDLLPKLICTQCDTNLDLCYRLRKQSEATHNRLMIEMQRKQKDNGSGNEQAVALNEDHSDCEKIDLSQYTDDSNESEMEENCSKTNDKQMGKNKFVNFIHKRDEPTKIIINQDFIENQKLDQQIEDNKKEILGKPNVIIEISEANNVCHGNNDISCTRSDSFTNTSENSCENTLKEVSEVPIVSEYCSIDLISSSESTTNECGDDIENEQAKKTLTDVNGLTCYTCHEVFTESREYRLHIKQHGLERYQCIQCCKFFPSRSRLKRHEEIHNEIPFHQCSYCNRSYRASYNLKRHIKSVHLPKKSWKCELCNFSFSRIDVLKRHLELHSDEKKYKCSICSQSFKTKDYLYGHRKTHHTTNSDLPKTKKRTKKDNASKNQCGYCGKMFKSLFAYKNHLLIHTNEKPYKCDSCSKHFRTIAALTTHQRIHDDYRPYQCDLCLKSFRQTAHLKEHRMLHLDNLSKHVCSICQAPFAKKSNLKAHMRIHTNEKPFRCADCSAQFSFMHLLQRHASKVHHRSIHKVYTLNDFDATLGVDGWITNNADVDSETFHYINTVGDDEEIDKNVANGENFSENNEDMHETSSPEEELLAKGNVGQHILYDGNCADAGCEINVDYGEIHSLNFIQPEPSDEDFDEKVNDSENYTKEQKVDILVTEETKLTNSVYNVYKME